MDLLEVTPDYKNNNNSSFESSVDKSRSASDPQLYMFPDHGLNLLIVCSDSNPKYYFLHLYSGLLWVELRRTCVIGLNNRMLTALLIDVLKNMMCHSYHVSITFYFLLVQLHSDIIIPCYEI
jgi:hypothetical protein